jgi:DNA adenine methylase
MNRPVMRYHGGKWKMAPTIISHFHSHRIYVEPFGGAGSVLMRKPRSYAEVYNDKFDDVVNVFRVLRDPDTAEKLRKVIELTPFSRTEFYTPINRSEPVEWARGVIFRSFAGFGSAAMSSKEYNTGFRANSTRRGTTPAHDWANFPKCIPDFVSRLKGVVIENRDAMDAMAHHDSVETLHYVDPPYVHETRYASKRREYAFEMNNDEHERLMVFIKSLKGMVAISGYSTDLYNDHLGGWRRVDFKALADGARERTECLWMNYSNMTLFT